MQHAPTQGRAIATDGDDRTSDGVAHHDLRGAVGRHRHCGEAIIGLDRGLYLGVFHHGRDVGELLDVLTVSNQVFPRLELLRELRRHSPGQGDGLLHFQRAVFGQVAFGNEGRGIALGVRCQSQRADEQTTGQETERNHRPDPMKRRWQVGGHEVQPPTKSLRGASQAQKRLITEAGARSHHPRLSLRV